jgi:hypothetical protein
MTTMMTTMMTWDQSRYGEISPYCMIIREPSGYTHEVENDKRFH